VTTDLPEAGKYDELRYKGWNDGMLNHGTSSVVNKNSAFQTYFMGKDFFSMKIPAAFQAAATASTNSKDYDPKLVQAAFKMRRRLYSYAEQVQCCFYRKGTNDPDADSYGFLSFRFRNVWIEKSAR
jgi:hypothetical protein